MSWLKAHRMSNMLWLMAMVAIAVTSSVVYQAPEEIYVHAVGSARTMPVDVEGHWAVRDVLLLQQMGVIDAYPDGKFRPDQAITRAEMVKMMVAAFGVMRVGPADPSREVTYPESMYLDVDETHWVRAFVYSASEEDLISGYPDGTFQPDEGLTRAEMAGLMHRFFSSRDGEGERQTLSDSAAIPAWAAPAVAWCLEVNLFRGFPDGTFRPQEMVTRGQAVVLLRRALELQGSLFTLSGEVLAVSSRTGVVTLGLVGDQVLEVRLDGALLYRGDVEISADEVQVGAYMRLLIDDQGEVIWADVPHLSFAAVLDSISLTDNRLRVRPIDSTPGEGPLSGWAGTAFWSAAADPGSLSFGDPVDVFWNEGTDFFRQGSSALSPDLRPGDRVYLTLGPDSPVLRHVDAVRYDSWGVIERVDSAEGIIEWVTGAGETVTGRITPNSRFEAQGLKVHGHRLKAGMYLGVVRARETSQIMYAEVFGLQDVASQPPHRDFHDRYGVHVPTSPRMSSEDDHMPHREAMGAVAGTLGPIEGDEYGQRHVSNSELIGASALRDAMGVDGSGVLVAVVDTGVDPLVPGIFSGRPGPVQWRDFTGIGTVAQRARTAPGSRLAEGDVITRTEISVSGREFYFQNERFIIEGPAPVGGVLKCGWVEESFFFPGGSSTDRVLVAALSTSAGGIYDAVYVDVNGDGILSEQELFTPLDRGGTPGTIVFAAESAMNFVVTEMDGEGRLVNLGFDGNGHGTQVTGVLAATGGNYAGGVSPGVTLMALKALSSTGSGSWENVIHAVQYAAGAGADIINVSVTGLHDLSSGSSRESQVLAEMAQAHDVLIITAVGNHGPGLATAYTPGDSRWTLSVGAAALPEIVRRDYGYSLPEPAVWQYSSVGPRADGALAPSVLGPGSMYAPVPAWMFSQGWGFFEGTSSAAAHVTGVAALLVQAARDANLGATMHGVKRSIEEGAQPLSGYLPVEQGYGVVDAMASWHYLRRDPRAIAGVSLGVSSGVMVERPMVEMDPQGIYLRDTVPGTLHVILENPGDVPSRVALGVAGLAAVRTALDNLILPGNARLSVPVHYGEALGSTIQSGFLIANDGGTPGIDARLLHTILSPIELSADKPHIIRAGELSAGKWDRHFFSVPEGTSHLDVNLQVSDPESGRVSFQIVNPRGQRLCVSPNIGAGSYSSAGEPVLNTSRVIQRPEAGVWEVIVSSAPSLSFYGLSSSVYQFQASVLARGSLLLTPGQVEWRFSQRESTPDYINTRIQIDVGGDAGEVAALLETMQPLGIGWVRNPEDVVVIPRQRLTTSPGEAHYIDFEVTPGADALTLWSGNVSEAGAEIEMFVYRHLEDGSVHQVLQSRLKSDGQLLKVARPVPGNYMLVTRPKADEACDYEVMAQVWPRTHDIQVNGPALGAGGIHNLHVRLAVPARPGDHWALVGLKAIEGSTLAEVWLHAEVGSSTVVFSPSLFVSPLAEPRMVIRNSADLRPAEGVVLIDDRLYTLDEDGTISMSVPHPQSNRRLSSFEVRFNSGDDEWSTPVRLSVPVLSRAELVEYRQGLLSLLSAGSYENPIIQARREHFFNSR